MTSEVTSSASHFISLVCAHNTAIKNYESVRLKRGVAPQNHQLASTLMVEMDALYGIYQSKALERA